MERIVGTVVRGIRAPIIKKGDDMAGLVAGIIENFWKAENIEPVDRDILAVTESIVARAQGNYATIEHIAGDVYNKFKNSKFALIFPILSRNRFAVCLRGFARGAGLGGKEITLMLSYPADEVGNHLVYMEQLDSAGINPWTDVLDEPAFRNHFGFEKHTFTGMDYIKYYKDIIESEGVDCRVIFANHPETILDYTKYIINCDIHTRKRTKNILLNRGAKLVYSLDEILDKPVNDSGFNEDYGLLGSNKATEYTVKLFPRDSNKLVRDIQDRLKKISGKTIEVMIYGDGAFKDPVGKIWELADPVVSPGYTDGLEGTPNEVKIKYLADNNFAHLSGDELKNAISEHIRHKEDDLRGNMESQGTTPRRLTDLIGSLCDLTSGSGDKGTPIVYIQGYFDNYIK